MQCDIFANMLTLFKKIEKYKERKAVRSAGNTFSYSEVEVGAKAIAAHLLGDQEDLKEARVAFMIPGSEKYIQTLWGVWMAGGIAVPLNEQYPIPSLAYILEDTGAKILIVADELLPLLESLANDNTFTLIPFSTLIQKSASQEIELPEISLDRSAMILYTSGTTSKPKGVLTTHATIESQIQTLVQAWAWEETDHILCVLPLHHVHGLINVCCCALWSGACVEFLPRFSPKAVFERFSQGEINLFMAVPTIYYKLIAYFEELPQEEKIQLSAVLERFRLMVSGSAALPISVLKKWRKISGHTLLERYGMTEIGMAISNPYDGERRPGHIGQALPGVELRLVDEQDLVVQIGEQGEIQVKGPNVFKAYWNKPEATAAAFTDDGWFRTGDVAVLADGYYRILGRKAIDIIKSGGYKISALEIEEILRGHPAIADCAIIGIPNEEWGEVIAAAIVRTKIELSFDRLDDWLKQSIPAYKVPRRYVVLEDLPKNVLGKVMKSEVRKWFR